MAELLDSFEKARQKIRMGLACAAVLGGIGACIWLISTKPSPTRRNEFERPVDVAVQVAEPATERAPIIGHGTVRPKNQISIVPQVSGALTYVHPELAQGRVIPQGTLLFQIDRTVYEARVAQAEAETKGLEAALARHDQELSNLDAQIDTASQMLAIDESDYETSRKLYEVEKVGTQRDLDAVRQKYLRQKSAFVELQSKRAMVPHLRLETVSQLDAARARHRQARHDLDATTITCPFEARVESIGAHQSQFVTAHLSIATLTDVAALELSVGIDPRELRWLDRTIRPEALSGSKEPTGPAVTVRWSLRGQELSWTGRVTRFEKVDEATRTARMVVEIREGDMVAEPRAQREIGPALAIGMFCRAELPAEPLQEALTVPRHAIYENEWVYVFTPDDGEVHSRTGRLERRRVPILRSIGDAVLVNYAGRDDAHPCELAPGDRIVVSPLSKPIVGMRIRLRDEQVTAAQGAARLPQLGASSIRSLAGPLVTMMVPTYGNGVR